MPTKFRNILLSLGGSWLSTPAFAIMMENLQDLLARAASDRLDRGIMAYPLGNTTAYQKLKYTELHRLAQRNSNILNNIQGLTKGSVILLHFYNHLDNIVWFWSILYAGYIPAMSTPFAHNPEHRDKHLLHLREVLDNPVCITTEKLLELFPEQPILRLRTVEDLDAMAIADSAMAEPSTHIKSSDLAILMLTSGSTGNSKVVRLTHTQVLASLAGKSATLVLELPSHHAFLNWIGLDHVGSLIEIHLHAMFSMVNQVHVQAQDLISDPPLFLEMISRHFVARTFAPNFFLAKLRLAIEKRTSEYDFDLSCLRYIVSGGEANVVETCSAVAKLLTQYHAPKSTIVPGFGMTETCAGSIYSLDCPRYDLDNGHEFASLGSCVPGIQMRASSMLGTGIEAKTGEPGNLEVAGPIVFKGYHNNPTATAEAFTLDGWFKTGDIAIIDLNGKLSLAGRTKEIISVNGVKYLPHEIETAIEEADIPGVIPSYTLSFSHRLRNFHTEQCCVVYLPSYAPEDAEARIRVLSAITKVVMLHTGARPYVLPLDASILQKSTLGKLSRTKTSLAFGHGDYRMYEEVNNEIVEIHRKARQVLPSNKTEQMLLEEIEQILDLAKNEIGMESAIFDFGITSIELIKFKRRIEERLKLKTEISMITIMTHSTLRSLGKALQDLGAPCEYDPVVTLQAKGDKVPLWLIHPGVGEILVFFGLAKFMDRPIHALRARGFNSGESFFRDITEITTVYYKAIKEKQPVGPYALAGYSYGSMIAFEIAKVFEKNGNEVRFLGCFNLPPHIKFRMRQLDWTECLLHLAFFLDIISEQYSHDVSVELHQCSKQDAIAHITGVASSTRMAELSLSSDKLANWADLAFALQNMARDYDPSGEVKAMDVFYCEPLKIVAQNKAEWRVNHLNKWNEFCKTEPRFHEVDGSHYTMIGADHVHTFQKKLRKALQARGT